MNLLKPPTSPWPRRVIALGAALLVVGIGVVFLAAKSRRFSWFDAAPDTAAFEMWDGPGHWAFRTPTRPDLPRVSDPDWPHNPLDRFILTKLEAAGMRPSPDADAATLARRVSLDLTGLPPTPEEVDAFLADSSPRAYESLVDRLLASRRYGEHMARFWLDAARYGDTNGLYHDNYREIWPYRDWVVRALNQNLPYNRFLTEQIAGDLFHGATIDQQTATGFLRCAPTTSDSAVAEEEARVDHVADMAETTASVALGLTIGCARCHDHKYDPIDRTDYYRFFAFFNNLDAGGYDYGARYPLPAIQVPTPRHCREADALRSRIADVKRAISAEASRWIPKTGRSWDGPEPLAAEAKDFVWFDDAPPKDAEVTRDPILPGVEPFVGGGSHPVLSGTKSFRQQARVYAVTLIGNLRPHLTIGADDRFFVHVYLDPDDPPSQIALRWQVDGWNHMAYWGEDGLALGTGGTAKRRYQGPLPEAGKWVRIEVAAQGTPEAVGLDEGTFVRGIGFAQLGGTVYWDKAGVATRMPVGRTTYGGFGDWLRAQTLLRGANLPESIRTIVGLDAKRWTSQQDREIREHFVVHALDESRSRFEPLLSRLAEAERELDALYETIPRTLTFAERREKRPTFVLVRGVFDRPGKPVEPGTPAFLPPFPAAASRDRLGLARWLTAREHPLTARVAVNRFWQQFFGAGLVRTAGDFGLLGDEPSHPELLDWLACEFQESGWNFKRLVKQIVTSRTYRQSSRASAEAFARDPGNRLLGRAPRLRLDAEALRDQALYLGGTLDETLGGPGVKLDEQTAGPYRRSIYAYWKRGALSPSLGILDAPSRESCVLTRDRTNTPLQALVMLNAPQWMDAARGMADRAVAGRATTPERLAYLFRSATSRSPTREELAELDASFHEHRRRYVDNVAEARRLRPGSSRSDGELADLAALTLVANAILNLDEVVTRE